jgi:hypothetical protein
MAPAMLSVNQLKNIDPELRDLSDEDVTEIRAKLYALAELALDCWIRHAREARTASPCNDDPEADPHGKLSP